MVLSTRRTREPRRSCVAQATALCAGPLFVCLFCLFAGPLFALDLSACAIFKTLLAAAGIKPQAMAMHTLLLPPNEVSLRRVRRGRVLAQMWASPGAISAGVPRCTRTRRPRRGSRSGSRAVQRCRPVLSTSDRCVHCGALLTDFGLTPGTVGTDGQSVPSLRFRVLTPLSAFGPLSRTDRGRSAA
jgi:hypothetical protein